MDEVKHNRFVKVVEKRMEILINDFYKLGNCSSRVSYDYTEGEVKAIFEELENQISVLRERFAGRKRFSLSTEEPTGGPENEDTK